MWLVLVVHHYKVNMLNCVYKLETGMFVFLLVLCAAVNSLYNTMTLSMLSATTEHAQYCCHKLSIKFS